MTPAVSPAAGTVLMHGEIVSWTCTGVTVSHLTLVEALRECGLDETVARELAPRHAFARACAKLSDRRIIRQVAEDDTAIQFQFTAEHRDGERFAYELETMLRLDKKSGAVACGLPGLAALAQEELDRCVAARTGGDVSRVVQKLFERAADLFPIRPQGGAYFLPRAHAGFADRVQRFLGRLNGQMLRYPVPAGTPAGDRSVQEAVAAGLAGVVAEHRAAVAGFGADTRADTLARAAERIRQTRFKVEAYAALLLDQKGRLDRELAEAAAALRAKVAELAAVPA